MNPLIMTDTRDLEALIADGLDSESAPGPSAALFSAPTLSLAELETLIAESLDRLEFEIEIANLFA